MTQDDVSGEQARERGRSTPSKPDAEYDADFYARMYPDLSHLSNLRLRVHWERVGRREGRIASARSVRRLLQERGIGDFDPGLYLALNPDLGESFGDDLAAATLHFLSEGIREGRSYRVQDVLAPSPPRTRASISSPMSSGTVPGWAVHAEGHVDLSSPMGLARSLLGRPFSPDDERAIVSWLEPMSPLDQMSALIGSPEFNSAEAQLVTVDAGDLVLAIESVATGHLPDSRWLDEMVTLFDYGKIRRDRYALSRAPQAVVRAVSELEGSEESRAPAMPVRASMRGPVATDALATDTDEGEVQFSVLGTGTTLTAIDWLRRRLSVEADESLNPRKGWPKRASILNGEEVQLPPGVVASALVSLYKPEPFLSTLLANCIEQTISSQVEFLFLLVQPTKAERDAVEAAAATLAHARVEVFTERIGIYEAWNRGIEISEGEFLTNMNADDLRRRDSLEIQAKTLHQYSWLDVVYQDVLYFCDHPMSWEQIERVGVLTSLPHVSKRGLRGMNSPHNGPMWRKALHEELGGFDANLRSAGDYEFWLRCVDAGKTFLKTRDPHVAYFVNPRGLSTAVDGPGQMEAWAAENSKASSLRYPAAPVYLKELDPAHALSRADRVSDAFCDRLLALRMEV